MPSSPLSSPIEIISPPTSPSTTKPAKAKTSTQSKLEEAEKADAVEETIKDVLSAGTNNNNDQKTTPSTSKLTKRPASPTAESSPTTKKSKPNPSTSSSTPSKSPAPTSTSKTTPTSTAKPKAAIGLVAGGFGSGGQTKLNFGARPATSSSTPKAATSASTPTSKSTPSTNINSLLMPSSSSSNSALKQNLSLPIPILPPSATPEQLQANIAEVRKLKQGFVDALSEEQRELLEMEVDSMGDDWLVGLRGELVKDYFLDLKRFIIAEQKKHKIFPPPQDIYSWTRFCPLAGIRVVIIGQDPYHNDGQAHGLAFSVRKGVAVPPSLRNMYKELENEYAGDFEAPKHGDLSSWARQGVLLLNTSLTVRAHEANSHSLKGWDKFTTRVLHLIIDRLSPTGAEPGGRGVVFLAWGAGAGKLVKGVSEKNHHVLTSAHPSPLSASRGFMGNGHFRKCNEWLEGRYGVGKGVDWGSVMRDT